MMQGSPTKNTASEREPAGAGQDDGRSTTKPGLTATEKRMLTRLEREGVLYARSITAPENRTLRRLVEKGRAAEDTADRGLRAWRVPRPTCDPHAEARLFAHGAIAELSAEILAWRRTGLLKGDRLLDLAKTLTALSPSGDALQQAERVVETLALELAASLGRANTPPAASAPAFLSNGEHAYPAATVASWPASKAARYVNKLYSASALEQAQEAVLRGRVMVHAESSRVCAALASAVRNGASDTQLAQLVRSKLAARGKGETA